MIGWRASYRELLESVGWIAFKLPFAVDVYLRYVVLIMVEANPIIQLLVVVRTGQCSLILNGRYRFCAGPGRANRGHKWDSKHVVRGRSHAVLMPVYVRGVQGNCQDWVLHTHWHASHANSIVRSNRNGRDLKGHRKKSSP